MSNKAELPNMDDILRDANRSESRRYIQLGALLIGGALALGLGTYSLLGGQVVFLASGAGILGLTFLVRGLSRRT
ncbi:MAG: hypothetical protein JWO36_4006 [Myxococcales bacterium]|nr:hypothetical protein [Myxococcales bacterium]